MKETENNGMASLKCRKKITIYSEFYELVKLSFKSKDAIKYFLKKKGELFKTQVKKYEGPFSLN